MLKQNKNEERTRPFEENELEKKRTNDEKTEEHRKRKAEEIEKTGLEGNALIGGSDSSRAEKRRSEEEEDSVSQVMSLVGEW